MQTINRINEQKKKDDQLVYRVTASNHPEEPLESTKSATDAWKQVLLKRKNHENKKTNVSGPEVK